MSVTIYTTPTCGYCKMAKKFFEENDVEYTEKNVAEDEEAREEAVDKSGQMGVPVIAVEEDGDEEVVVGFDKDKLSDMLEI
ncbi:MAG: glutaredoxin family protein [Candidatus Magasanikbacteria bacterium]